MLVFAKPGPDFSRGCTVERIGLSLFATHPHHAAIREVTLGDTPSLPIGLGLCRIAVMAFEDVPSTPSGE
jgi:hypothetical protein